MHTNNIFLRKFIFQKKCATKRPIGALLSIFAVVILFWAVFKLNGSALNTWADRYTDRQVTGTTEKYFQH
jgi:POT family proton-dependent oligopeptide transporter